MAQLQTDITQPLELLTDTYDLGSAAATHCCVECRLETYLEDDGNDIFLSQQNESLGGRINQDYIEWTLVLEYSDDASTWLTLDAKAALNSDVIVTARYFRYRLSAHNIPDENNYRVARVSLEYFETAFSRA